MARVNDAQKSGDFGENYVRNVVETGWGCFFNPSGNRDRFGIDGTVTVVVNGKVQPLQFHVQVKTRKSKDSRKTTAFRAPVTKEDLKFWRDLNVPVVLICIEVGTATRAYWHLVNPNTSMPLYMSRRKEFDPGCRDAVIGAVRKAFRLDQRLALWGRLLSVPLNGGVRQSAKEYYRSLKKDKVIHPIYGPINFTWKGWRHITRKKRSISRITQALLILPSLRSILSSPIQPVDYRELTSIRRGNLTFSRTLIVFEPMIRLNHRADVRARVIIERDTVFPNDWASSHPSDPRRQQICRFYSLSELRTPSHKMISYESFFDLDYNDHERSNQLVRTLYSLLAPMKRNPEES